MLPVFGIFIRGSKLQITQPIDVVSDSTTDGVVFGGSLAAITRRMGRLIWLLSVTLLMSSILSGCGGLVMGSIATSVQFSPTTIDFGDVDVGTAAESVVSLNNQSPASTNIAGFALTGTGFALHDKVVFPLALGARSSKGVSVDFAPLSEGDFTGELSAMDSFNRPLASMRVRGHGRHKGSHRLTVTPTTLDFGSLSVNSTATLPVTLAATGTGSVTIDSAVPSDASFTVSGVTFPLTLRAGQSQVLNVTFKPTAAAIISGELSIKTNSEDSSAASVKLTGTGVVPPGVSPSVPQLTVSTTSLSFGNVTVNSTATKTITLTSTGTGPVTVKGVGIAGTGYAVTGSTFPASLNPGASLTLQVGFDPKTTGASPGSLNINSSANATTTVSLSGTGVSTAAPQLTVSATSLSFGNVTVNSTATKTITLTSAGTGPVTVKGVGVAGTGYAVAGSTFPVSMNPGASLTLQVAFDPKTTGASPGSLNISSSTNATTTVSLSGTGVSTAVPQLTVSTTSLSFGNVTVNSTATKTITLTSTGTGPVTVKGVGIAGTGYAVTGSTFPVSLNPGASLTLQVAFDPKTTGASPGSLNISSSANATTTVSLSGTGVSTAAPQLTVSATSLSFGNVTVNSTATKTITLTSTGTGPVTVKGVGVAGSGYAVAGSTFPVSLNPGASLTLQVAFDPKTTGASPGSLNISSSTNAAATVSLSGTGVSTAVPQLTVSTTSLSFGNVTVKTNMPKTVTLTSTGTAPVTLTGVSVSGSGFSASAMAVPLKLNPGQTLNLQITFTPTATGAATGSLILTSDSSTNATTTVSLSGTGASTVNAMLTVSATTLDFGSIAVGLPVAQVITLTSTGNAAVTVSKVSVTGSGFTISGLTFPVTLNPTIAVKLTVVFTPIAAGTSTGQLTIASNSSSGSTALVSLNGSATSTQHSVDLTWSAPANSPAPVSSYKIYRSAANGSFTVLNGSVIGKTSYVDSTVQSGTTYDYYVTSVDASGTESAPSNEIGLTVP
jgi:Abnormal spindle-like microcephaly-assoc'd, ASPM-SPD-2-Hydin